MEKEGKGREGRSIPALVSLHFEPCI